VSICEKGGWGVRACACEAYEAYEVYEV